MDRHIVCLQIPAFRILLARGMDHALRNRPVAVAPMHTPRAVIREISDEAFREGIQPGMPVDLGRLICPGLQLIPPDPSTDSRRSSRPATPHRALCTGLGINQAGLALPGPHRHKPALRSSHRYSDPHRPRVDPSAGVAQRNWSRRKQAGLATGRHHAHKTIASVVDSLRM